MSLYLCAEFYDLAEATQAFSLRYQSVCSKENKEDGSRQERLITLKPQLCWVGLTRCSAVAYDSSCQCPVASSPCTRLMFADLLFSSTWRQAGCRGCFVQCLLQDQYCGQEPLCSNQPGPAGAAQLLPESTLVLAVEMPHGATNAGRRFVDY